MLRELIEPDFDTGWLVWKPRGPEWFANAYKSPAASQARRFNDRYAHQEALDCLGHQGYLTGTLLGNYFAAHRVIWALHTGEFVEQIDHINRNRTQNYIDNLRDGAGLVNARNHTRQKNGASGHVGVHWCKLKNMWIVQIGVNNAQVYGGAFPTYGEAVASRLALETKYGYVNNGK
jgi:hypothetical protein